MTPSMYQDVDCTLRHVPNLDVLLVLGSLQNITYLATMSKL